jgi:hypothetical protein
MENITKHLLTSLLYERKTDRSGETWNGRRSSEKTQTRAVARTGEIPPEPLVRYRYNEVRYNSSVKENPISDFALNGLVADNSKKTHRHADSVSTLWAVCFYFRKWRCLKVRHNRLSEARRSSDDKDFVLYRNVTEICSDETTILSVPFYALCPSLIRAVLFMLLWLVTFWNTFI